VLDLACNLSVKRYKLFKSMKPNSWIWHRTNYESSLATFMGSKIKGFWLSRSRLRFTGMSHSRESLDTNIKKIRKSHVESTHHTKIVSTIGDQKWETPSKSDAYHNCFTLDRMDTNTKPIILVKGSCYLVRCYGNALNFNLLIKNILITQKISH